MAELKGFSKDAKSIKAVQAEARASGQRAKRREPGEAPVGYEQDLWTLAIEFKKYAWKDKIELASDLPVIHDGLADLVSRHGIRKQTYRHEVRGCTKRLLPPVLAARCWYHWPPDDPGRQESGTLTWYQMVEVIMAEFWSRVQNEHALEHFRQFFAEYGQAALNHWNNLRVLKDTDGKMQRRAAEVTMQDVSKEG